MDLKDQSIDVIERHTELVDNLKKSPAEIKNQINDIDLKVITVISAMSANVSNLLYSISAQLIEDRKTDNDSDKDYDQLHMAVGVLGEMGELLDAVKKSVIYRKPLDRENLIEELGDIMFYARGFGELYQGDSEVEMVDIIFSDDKTLGFLLDVYEVTKATCLEANINKLSERYSSGKYSDKQAQDRADKEGK